MILSEMSRQFLTAGPIPMGDIASGAIAELTKAIDKLSNNNTNELSKVVDLLKGDKANTEKVVTILTTLREAFKQAAKDSSQKGITPELQRQLAEALVALKGIGDLKELTTHLKKFGTGLGNQALSGRGAVGTATTAAATAIDPGLGLLVKAAQENAQAIKETFHILGEGFKLTIDVFRGIYRFFSPHKIPQRGFMGASVPSVGGRGGGFAGAIGRAATGTAIGRALVKAAPGIGKAIGLGFIAAVGVGLGLKVTSDSDTPEPDKNPKGKGKTVPSSQPDPPVSAGPIEGGVHLLGGFDAVSADQQKEDTIIKFLQVHTELLAEILRTLQKGNIVVGGGVKFLAEGGVVHPRRRAVVGERGPEHVRSRGRSEVVTKPSVVQAKDSPVTVTPIKDDKGHRDPNAGRPPLAKPAISDPMDQTFHPPTSTIYYTGPTGSKSVTYTDPETGATYTDRTKPIGPAQSGLPQETPGIAYGYNLWTPKGKGPLGQPGRRGRETLGGYYLVTPERGENAGQSFILPHSDIGPGGPAGKHPDILDYNAPASQMVFGSMKESALQGGAYLRYIGANLPEGVTAGKQPSEGISEKYKLSPEHSGFIQKQLAATSGAATTEARGYSPVPGSQPTKAPSAQAFRELRGQDLSRSSASHPIMYSPREDHAEGFHTGQRADLGVGRDMPTASDMHHGIAMLDDTAHRIQTEDHEEERLQAPPHPAIISPSQSPSGAIFSDVGMATLGGQGFS
jgi:hypothetical protein